MKSIDVETGLDALHHVAIVVDDIAAAVQWYTERFRCRVEHTDDTWAMLGFDNVRLALVVGSQHPPHIAFASPQASHWGDLATHRDGSRSIYARDPSGNTVEILDAASL